MRKKELDQLRGTEVLKMKEARQEGERLEHVHDQMDHNFAQAKERQVVCQFQRR